MTTTLVEMAGGILQLLIAGAVLWAVAEIGCQIFFKIREREGEQ